MKDGHVRHLTLQKISIFHAGKFVFSTVKYNYYIVVFRSLLWFTTQLCGSTLGQGNFLEELDAQEGALAVKHWASAATWFIFNSVPLISDCSHWEGRYDLDRVQRSTSPHALGLPSPRRESGALSDHTRERWAACEYPKGLGHHASGCDIELETPPRPTTDYLGEWITTRVRSHIETAFISHTQPLPRKAGTSPSTQ